MLYYSLTAVIIRILSLFLFEIFHPFPAAILNESVDSWDGELSPLLSDKELTGNMKYQIPDKIWDFILYACWLLLMPRKWFSKLLWFSILFRGIGMAIFLKTRNDYWLSIFPNIFLSWFLIFYGLDYFNIHIKKSTLNILLLLGVLAKIWHEDILRGAKSEPLRKVGKLIKGEVKKHFNISSLTFYISTTLLIFITILFFFRTKKLFKPMV